MPLALTGVADFTAMTIANYERGIWTDLSLDLPDYVSTRMIKDHMVYNEGGTQLTWDVQVDYTDTFRATGPYDVDITPTGDDMIQASVPWKHYTANYSYDLKLDTFQSGRETIISYVVEKEHGMRNSIADGLERETWSLAPSGSARAQTIPYYIVKSSTTPGGALTGGAPSGYTTVADINPTTYDQWRNWAGIYTNVTTDDLISKVKKAMFNTNFIAPDPHPELGFSKAMVGLYTVYSVRESLERLAETRNDRLGSDVAMFVGKVTIGGTPVTAVPYLDANDSTNPVYGINWRYMRPFSKRGEWMKLTGPKDAPNQHTVKNVFCDITWNWKCVNRRAQWVMSTGT